MFARPAGRSGRRNSAYGELIDPRDYLDPDYFDGGGPMHYYGPSHAPIDVSRFETALVTTLPAPSTIASLGPTSPDLRQRRRPLGSASGSVAL
jgi:hypothetical protein